ncbi:T9SS type A sorting domain-containing protein [Hymenobacter edaphi]|nr:T9SS type A sorting domain-containing protein [Hymenobacter edaphi]
MRAGNAWRYGWVRLTMLDLFSSHFQVDAYALQAVPLAALPAQQAAAWQVYPVPAGEQLTIQPPAGGAARATLLDNLGRAVAAPVELAGGRPAQLPLSGLPAGLYLLRVETPQGSFTRRVQKQ